MPAVLVDGLIVPVDEFIVKPEGVTEYVPHVAPVSVTDADINELQKDELA